MMMLVLTAPGSWPLSCLVQRPPSPSWPCPLQIHDGPKRSATHVSTRNQEVLMATEPYRVEGCAAPVDATAAPPPPIMVGWPMKQGRPSSKAACYR